MAAELMEIPFYAEEKLYRKVPNNPIMWREDGGISTAAFKDSKGMSVDRQMKRSNLEAIETLTSHHSDVKAIVSTSYQFCTETIEALVIYAPCEDNIYHSEIHKDSQKPQLSRGQLKKLVDNCTLEIIN